MKGKYKVLKDNFKNAITIEFEKTIPILTEEYEAKIRRQAEEITRLLAENKELKEDKAVLNAKIDSYELYGDQHEEEYNQAFNQGAETGWELVRKIGNMPYYAAEEIFGIDFIFDLVRNYTYHEAVEKVAEWEETKEIKVGDIVRAKRATSIEFCVTKIGYDGNLYGIGRNGAIYSDKSPEDWEKTGRHIDIDSFLRRIGGESDDDV